MYYSAHMTSGIVSLLLPYCIVLIYIYLCVCLCTCFIFFYFFRVIICSIEQTLLQILTLFERVLKRDSLSSNFATTEELLGSCTQSGSSLHDFSDPRSVPVLPWIPQTMTAVALRLFELDASVIYLKQEKPEPFEDKEVREYIVSIFFFLMNSYHCFPSFWLCLFKEVGEEVPITNSCNSIAES